MDQEALFVAILLAIGPPPPDPTDFITYTWGYDFHGFLIDALDANTDHWRFYDERIKVRREFLLWYAKNKRCESPDIQA